MTLPADWDSIGSRFRGVSQSVKLGGYLSVLLLNGRQNHFGPFRTGRLEAANAYDRLMRYFLPFVKEKPVPNCPADAFIAFTDEETENLYGKERLQKLRARLADEVRKAGLDIDIEASRRLDYVIGNCGLHSNTLATNLDKRRRRAILLLNGKCQTSVSGLALLDFVNALGLSGHDYAQYLGPSIDEVTEAFKAAKAKLEKLVELSQTLTGIDINKA